MTIPLGKYPLGIYYIIYSLYIRGYLYPYKIFSEINYYQLYAYSTGNKYCIFIFGKRPSIHFA